MGEHLTFWSIRLSLLCYVAALALCWWNPSAWPLRRRLWTLGFSLFIVHMLAAFAFYHSWSHADAVADTARQTKELVGVEFGGGIYFNYVFALVWSADVALWWAIGAAYVARPLWLKLLVQGYLFFIAVNGAIVFAAGPTRWVGIAACAALGILIVRSRLRKRTVPSPQVPR
jgi:hypothetical protein